MQYEDFKNYIQEHWDNVVEITEGSLSDKAMKGLIKFARSDNPISKGLRKRGMRQAKKYEKRRDAKLTAGLELIADEVSNMVIEDIKKHGAEIINGDIKPNKSGTAITINISFKPAYNDYKSINTALNGYLKRCVSKKQLLTYDYNFTNGSFKAKLKLFK